MKKAIALALALLAAASLRTASAQYGAENMEDVLLMQAAPLQTVLDVGVRGEHVRQMQQTLVKRGFLQGGADGIYGGKTAQAIGEVKAYLQDLGVAQAYVDDFAPDSAVSSALYVMLTQDAWEAGERTLQPGESSEAVRVMQRRLLELAYPAESDGTFGSKTEYGIELFRYFQAGGEGTQADAALRRALFSDEAIPARYVPLSQGSRGSAVKNLQLRLRLAGFLTAEADGSYGAQTAQAVTRMQECMAARGFSVQNNGEADPYLQEMFFEQFDLAPGTLRQGDSGPEVARMQRRLTLYGFEAGSGDGEYGAATAAAVRRFQKRNDLAADGIAGIATLSRLYSNEIKGALRGYQLKISLSDQKVYAYAPDENYAYTRFVRSMTCSTGLSGTPTPKGTFTNTGPGLRWHYFRKYDCWAQYAYYIQGDIMFHSVLYSEKDEDTLLWGSVYKLGSPASHGCVRLAVEDARWIYNNCAAGTKIIVY